MADFYVQRCSTEGFGTDFVSKLFKFSSKVQYLKNSKLNWTVHDSRIMNPCDMDMVVYQPRLGWSQEKDQIVLRACWFKQLGMPVSNCTKYLTSCFPTIIMVESICSAILSVQFGTNPVKKPTDCRDYAVYLTVQGHYKLQLTVFKFKITRRNINALHDIITDIQRSTSCLEQAAILNQPK